MIIQPSGNHSNLVSQRTETSAGLSVFGQDSVSLGRGFTREARPTSASGWTPGGWDNNWRPDANPQVDYERIRRINDIRNELNGYGYTMQRNGQRLQQISSEFSQLESCLKSLNYEDDNLVYQLKNLTHKLNTLEADRYQAKENRRYEAPGYDWTQIIDNINTQIDQVKGEMYRINERRTAIGYQVSDKSRQMENLRTEAGRLNEENSRLVWVVKDRQYEWKNVFSQMQNPSWDLQPPV